MTDSKTVPFESLCLTWNLIVLMNQNFIYDNFEKEILEVNPTVLKCYKYF